MIKLKSMPDAELLKLWEQLNAEIRSRAKKCPECGEWVGIGCVHKCTKDESKPRIPI